MEYPSDLILFLLNKHMENVLEVYETPGSKLVDEDELLEVIRMYKTAKIYRRAEAVWEQYFGSVPDGYAPFFVDGDPDNLSRDNLVLNYLDN